MDVERQWEIECSGTMSLGADPMTWIVMGFEICCVRPAQSNPLPVFHLQIIVSIESRSEQAYFCDVDQSGSVDLDKDFVVQLFTKGFQGIGM